MTTTGPPYQPPASPPPYPYAPYPTRMRRPVGVTILAVLDIIAGIIVLLGAIGAFVLAGYLSSSTVKQNLQQHLPTWFLNIAPVAMAALGMILLVIAIIIFLVARGFLKGRNWSRVLAIVLLVLSIISSVFDLIATATFIPGALIRFLIAIIIPVLLIIYLTRPGVKAWFHQPRTYY